MNMIIGSGFGLIMWIGIIGLGLVVPFIFSIKGEAKRPQSYLIVSALELIGGFCLRYVILIGGQI